MKWSVVVFGSIQKSIFWHVNLAYLQKCSLYSGERSVPLGALVIHPSDVLWYGYVRPGLRPSGSPSARFPHLSPTCFDILSWNFAHDFVLMYYRSSLSFITLRQFLKELCLFVNLEYRKYTVFRTFLLHALTYSAEILHMTLFWCTTEQVRVSSLCINFWRSFASFGT